MFSFFRRGGGPKRTRSQRRTKRNRELSVLRHGVFFLLFVFFFSSSIGEILGSSGHVLESIGGNQVVGDQWLPGGRALLPDWREMKSNVNFSHLPRRDIDRRERFFRLFCRESVAEEVNVRPKFSREVDERKYCRLVGDC